MVGFRRILEVGLDCVCPRRCVRCAQEGSLLCLRCADAWVITPPPNGCPACEPDRAGKICVTCSNEWSLDGLRSMDSYADPVLRRLIGAWKYTGDQAAWEVIQFHLKLFVATLRPYQYEAVTWIPLHAARRRGRGFDQAESIARAAASALNIPCEQFIERVVHTPPRAKTQSGARGKDDMSGVFVGRGTPLLESEPRSRRPERVLLVDDVFTSGGTMDAAARALKEGGAKEVWGLTLARG